MRLDRDEAWSRLAGADHAILATVHAERGADAVPVVFATDGSAGGGLPDDGGAGPPLVAIPVDRVKPKVSTRLQRERNLAADPRATLLVEHWDAADWSRLWWVRAGLRRVADPPADRVERLTAALAGRYPQYADRPFADVLVLEVTDLVGWSAADTSS